MTDTAVLAPASSLHRPSARRSWADVSDAEVREEHTFPPLGPLLRAAGDLFEGETRFRTFEGSDGVQFCVGGIGRFWVDPTGQRIGYELEPGCPQQDATHVLTGPVIGMAIQLAGRVILHASGMVVGGRAVAMSAPSGMGKSTLCAAFGRAGYPLLADDMLVLDSSPDAWMARSYLPQIKLWDDSLAAFGEPADAFTPVLSWVDKRRIVVNERWGTIADGTFPLSTLYLLEPMPSPSTELTIRTIPVEQAALHVMAAMYMPETLRGRRAVTAFDAAAKMAESVPVRRLRYYRSFENLPAIREAVLRDVEGITPSHE